MFRNCFALMTFGALAFAASAHASDSTAAACKSVLADISGPFDGAVAEVMNNAQLMTSDNQTALMTFYNNLGADGRNAIDNYVLTAQSVALSQKSEGQKTEALSKARKTLMAKIQGQVDSAKKSYFNYHCKVFDKDLDNAPSGLAFFDGENAPTCWTGMDNYTPSSVTQMSQSFDSNGFVMTACEFRRIDKSSKDPFTTHEIVNKAFGQVDFTLDYRPAAACTDLRFDMNYLNGAVLSAQPEMALTHPAAVKFVKQFSTHEQAQPFYAQAGKDYLSSKAPALCLLDGKPAGANAKPHQMSLPNPSVGPAHYAVIDEDGDKGGVAAQPAAVAPAASQSDGAQGQTSAL